MAKFYVMRTGQTTWEEQSRIESTAGAPLTEQGAMQVRDAARELTDHGIKAVFACTTGQAESQTAQLVADALSVKVRGNGMLHELDYGLWQGLTRGEIKRSQPRAYRQWTKAPASVRPPEGETLQEAQERLKSALRDITKRHRNGTALLVLRPVLMGLLRCLSEDQSIDALWQHVDDASTWGCYEVDLSVLGAK